MPSTLFYFQTRILKLIGSGSIEIKQEVISKGDKTKLFHFQVTSNRRKTPKLKTKCHQLIFQILKHVSLNQIISSFQFQGFDVPSP